MFRIISLLINLTQCSTHQASQVLSHLSEPAWCHSTTYSWTATTIARSVAATWMQNVTNTRRSSCGKFPCGKPPVIWQSCTCCVRAAGRNAVDKEIAVSKLEATALECQQSKGSYVWLVQAVSTVQCVHRGHSCSESTRTDTCARANWSFNMFSKIARSKSSSAFSNIESTVRFDKFRKWGELDPCNKLRPAVMIPIQVNSRPPSESKSYLIRAGLGSWVQRTRLECCRLSSYCR